MGMPSPANPLPEGREGDKLMLRGPIFPLETIQGVYLNLLTRPDEGDQTNGQLMGASAEARPEHLETARSVRR